MHRTRLAALAIGVTALVTTTAGLAVAGHDRFVDGPFGVHDAGVHFVSDTGITAGCDATGTRYCPGNGVTRAQMATFMHRLSGNADGVAPSVDAAALDGLVADDLLITSVFADGEIVDGQGVAECPDGTVVVGGGFVQDEGQAHIATIDVSFIDEETELDFWVVELVDPVTGTPSGSGLVEAVCAAPQSLLQTASSSSVPTDAGEVVERLRASGPGSRR